MGGMVIRCCTRASAERTKPCALLGDVNTACVNCKASLRRSGFHREILRQRTVGC
ncbi:hypothetical protein I552_5445 [Mycobacterium xenopi 3993]|nr:hypothetical protein I552_5445 [Mycobacterium xenopi 3993]